MNEKKTILQTAGELRNILQGLDLLHSKCIDNLKSIQPFDPAGADLKKYFKDKQVEINQQIMGIKKILLIQNEPTT